MIDVDDLFLVPDLYIYRQLSLGLKLYKKTASKVKKNI